MTLAGARRIVFLDRDGTLNEEPPDEQVDSLEKIRLMPGVISALMELRRADFELVPAERFEAAHRFILDLFASQGVEFDAVFICPHFKREGCACRKPGTALVRDYLASGPVDLAGSFMVGDRDTDLEFAANLGVVGLRIALRGSAEEAWPALAARITRGARSAQVRRKTKETEIEVRVDLGASGPIHVATGLGFFDHMLEQIAKHGGFALDLRAHGDLHVDEHHTVEDSALSLGTALREALGDKRGIGRYGFLLAMDEAEAQVALDLSGRPYFVWEGHFGRERVGELPTELVPHFFRSLAETLGAALHVSVRGDNSHHMVESCFKGVGRSLRQAFRREGVELPTTKGVL
jgi:imidazoleglycerol-phosphate dehydratase/histidinol-phosphatase